MEEKLQRILGVGAFIESVQAGLFDASAVLGLRGAIGKVTRGTLFGLLRHARSIVYRATNACETRLRVAVVQPRRAGWIGGARILAGFAIACDAIEVTQIGNHAGTIGMLLGAFHLADQLLPDRSFRAAFGDEFLADGFGRTGSERARTPHPDGQIALTSQRRAVITGQPDTFVTDWKMDGIAASLGEVGALGEERVLFSLFLRGLLLGLLCGRSTPEQREDRDEHK